MTHLQYTREELEAGIQEAHRVGKPAAVHASWADAVDLAIESGADSIEHGHVITDALVARLVEREAFLVPTLWHYRRVALHGKELGFSEEVIGRAGEICDLHAQSFVRAWKGGVRIAAGTDSGGPQYAPGSLPLELQYMAELGMPPLDVLRAATSEAASCLRLEKRVGRLEPGYAGDLIGVSTDPLGDPSTLRRPWLVVKAGEIVVYEEA